MVVAAILGLAAIWADKASKAPRPPVGFTTSLPVFWAESDTLIIEPGDASHTHWLRGWLEQRYAVTLLDLVSQDNMLSLDRLILAQPRPLQPAEFAALDGWVRAGGRVLIFADPVLTEDSHYPLGDPRRPQSDALMSPLLARWGLEQVVEDQPLDLRRVPLLGGDADIRMAGRFRAIAGGAADCVLEDNALLAQCAVGKGRALIIGDAAMLELRAGSPVDRAAIERLTRAAFE